MNKKAANAYFRRTVCDLCLWLCRFDEGHAEIKKEQEEYLKLKAKHEEVIQKWKQSKQSD